MPERPSARRCWRSPASTTSAREDVVGRSGCQIGALWAVPASRWFEVRVFAGPPCTVFSVIWLPMSSTPKMGIPTTPPRSAARRLSRVKTDAWGFHVGGDIAWMFTRAVGLGAMARCSRAESDVRSSTKQGALALRFGGLQFGGGLRFRFGSTTARREPTSSRPTRPDATAAPPVPQEGEPVDVEPGVAPSQDAPSQERQVGPASPDSALVNRDSPVFVRPGALEPLQVLSAGTRVRVRQAVGDWLIIEFKDTQWGIRVGYILRENCDWR